MRYFMQKSIVTLLLLVNMTAGLMAQPTVMRQWNELLLKSISEDLNRANVQARTIFHFSVAMYDAWAAYDDVATPYLLGKTVNGYTCAFTPPPKPQNIEAARKEAMSFAAYRFLMARFSKSPQSTGSLYRYRELMQSLGYDPRNYNADYSTGSPAALGNYIAQSVLQMASNDESKEANNYFDNRYQPYNTPLEVATPGVGPDISPNHWQPLKLNYAIDLDGYPVYECACRGRTFASLLDSLDERGNRIFTGTQTCQGADWGRVKPFALERKNLKVYQRNRRDYHYYHNTGEFFFNRLDSLKGGNTAKEYMWNYALVLNWSALLNPKDTLRWEVSPRSMGNIAKYPANRTELPAFYDFNGGRDASVGHSVNPRSGQPYAPVWIPRGDYIRVAARYWAEGPADETPPGHWLSLLNYVSDRPELVKKFNGKGPVMNDLEWEVKSCFALGAALHDAAIAAWGLKGRFDGPRPITALRYMATRGQSSDPKQPSYHWEGMPLLPGRVAVVTKNDTLAGARKENVGKIKFYTWKGADKVKGPNQTAGIGWILGENWVPYQDKKFITPPFSAFVSSHAAFAHSGAEVLQLLTGDPYFPGGMGEYVVHPDSQFVKFERSPAMPIPLQWATYRDAADQASLSCIWAGIQAPCDDIPGRLIGQQVGETAFQLAKTYFYKDRDADGYFSYEDCDDNNPAVHPGTGVPCDPGDKKH